MELPNPERIEHSTSNWRKKKAVDRSTRTFHLAELSALHADSLEIGEGLLAASLLEPVIASTVISPDGFNGTLENCEKKVTAADNRMGGLTHVTLAHYARDMST